MGHKNARMLFTVYAKWIDGADRGREKAKLQELVRAIKKPPEGGRLQWDSFGVMSPECPWRIRKLVTSEEKIGRRDWTRTNDPHHVKVVL